jgi:myo-inositol catabolism protein IolS
MDSRPSLSRICFGCEPLGGTDWGEVSVPNIAEAVERALDLGVNFFDTADVYGLGLSESRLAEILGARRHDVIIATKGGVAWRPLAMGMRAAIRLDSSPAYLYKAVDESLRRLRLDRLPIYFVHWPDPDIDIRVTFECLSHLQHIGKIGWIGCSNFSADQVRIASEVTEVSFVQLPLNILGQEMDPAMQKLVLDKRIDVIAYDVLAKGLLSGKFNTETRFLESDRRSRLPIFQGEAYRSALQRVQDFSSIASRSGMTCAQYSIMKILDLQEVRSVILGIKTRAQIEENAAILFND